jgi:ABC-type amino acid transport substrate-binding protein
MWAVMNKNVLIPALLFIACMARAENKVYAVIDLPPYGCEPSEGVGCINTEITQLIANAIEGKPATIHAFPYPRALHMFESGKSSILVALMNKRLMEQADIIELYYGVFYLVAIEKDITSKRPTIAYLRGADAQKEIADTVDATPVEVNDYRQIIKMLKANRLDYVVIPGLLYHSEVKAVFNKAHVISEHSLPIVLYVNRQEAQHLGKIRDAVSQLSLHISEQCSQLNPQVCVTSRSQ